MGKKNKKNKKIKKRLKKQSAKQKHNFTIGDSVVVKQGVQDPDYEKLDISGWQGRIFQIIQPNLIGITLDSITIRSIPQYIFEQCESDEINWMKIYLNKEDIMPTSSRDSEEDVFEATEEIKYKYNLDNDYDYLNDDDDDDDDDDDENEPIPQATHKFEVGDSVVIKKGSCIPDDKDFDISGWQGRIYELYDDYEEDRIIASIMWDSPTLKKMPRSFIENAEKDYEYWTEMGLYTHKLLPSKPEDSENDTYRTTCDLSKKYNLDRFSRNRFNYRYSDNIPTEDLFDEYNPDDINDHEEILEELIYKIEKGYYLAWEAVIADELNQHLTFRQKIIFSKLISFNDDDERTLYIDERARPSEPWYETVRKVVSLITSERVDMSVFPETIINGWPKLVEVLEEHGKHLMLPENVESPVDVVPKEIQDKLSKYL
ncbi:hypothetical protein MHK_004662 [Candidatus Magnetomorum sp. HK-1]|nr:hypothetical protein MHK_004662 [Candidatus Magnetomorum sp. HK-1]